MFHRSGARFENSPGKFRMMALVTVLQRDLGVRDDPACQEGPYCALDPRTLFIHGLLDGHGGTCVTMPVLYVAIGRRLGYPLFLVQAREHFLERGQAYVWYFTKQSTKRKPDPLAALAKPTLWPDPVARPCGRSSPVM